MKNNIWFTSDTHFGHSNIVLGTSKWADKESCRKFSSIEEHDETLINNINSLVKPDDVLYHLGDWSFGGHFKIPIYRKRIKCKNINLIIGNHDSNIRRSNSPYKTLFSSIKDADLISVSFKDKKQNIFLSHYAHSVWPESHHGCVHLFGHSHNSLKGVGKSMDVGMDTNWYFPYSLDEIMFYMESKEIFTPDHHNSSTDRKESYINS